MSMKNDCGVFGVDVREPHGTWRHFTTRQWLGGATEDYDAAERQVEEWARKGVWDDQQRFYPRHRILRITFIKFITDGEQLV